MKIKLVIEEP